MSPPAPPVAADRFRSVAEMKRKHVALSDTVRESVLAPGHPERIAEFVRKTAATGAVLESRNDRAAAQGLINFWNALLSTERAEDWEKRGRPESGPGKDDTPTLLAGYNAAAVKEEVDRADAWFEALPEDRRDVARRVLLRLVSLQPTGTKYFPGGIHSDDLAPTAEDPAVLAEVIDGLKKADVIRSERDRDHGGEILSLPFEPLTRLWKPYASWVQQRLRFREMAEYWDETRDDALLIDGPLLRMGKTYSDLNEAEKRFVGRCEEAAAAFRQKQEAEREKLARARLQWNRLFIGGLIALIVGLFVALAVYEAKRREVRREAELGKLRRGIAVRVQDERADVEAKYVALYDAAFRNAKLDPKAGEWRDDYDLRQKVRGELNRNRGVVTPGSYLGTDDFGQGGVSVCAVVRDVKARDQLYLLTAGYVLDYASAKGGEPIYCPPPPGEGRVKVGVYDKGRSDRYYALIKLDPGVRATNDLPVLDGKTARRLRAPAGPPGGALVRLVGSGSGVSAETEVLSSDSPKIHWDELDRFFAGLTPVVNKRLIVTRRISAPRDGGAPVFTPAGGLVGMLYLSQIAGYDPATDQSWSLPFDWICEKAGVELVE